MDFSTREGSCHFLKECFQEVVPEEDAVPGAVVAIHSFGDFLGWHPHLHILCTDGCFYGDGMFRVTPLFELKHLEAILRHKVFKIVLSKGTITDDPTKRG
ncbi:MAG: transposase [Candidatus Desulfacyla sp.]